MPNYNSILQKAIEEDAKLGKARVRVLSLPSKAKKKNGEDIKKLPVDYKVIDEYESAMKKDYSKIFSRFIIPELKKILK